jgi:hypothetical protein
VSYRKQNEVRSHNGTEKVQKGKDAQKELSHRQSLPKVKQTGGTNKGEYDRKTEKCHKTEMSLGQQGIWQAKLFITKRLSDMLILRILPLIANKKHTKQLKDEIKAINSWGKYSNKNVKALTEAGARILQVQEDEYLWSPENREE